MVVKLPPRINLETEGRSKLAIEKLVLGITITYHGIFRQQVQNRPAKQICSVRIKSSADPPQFLGVGNGHVTVTRCLALCGYYGTDFVIRTVRIVCSGKRHHV